jgi:hypothetical protein
VFFLFFGPLLFSNLITFFFLFLLNDLKCYKSATWNSTNHLELQLHSKRATYKDFFRCLGTDFGSVWWFFCVVLTPFTLGACNFLISNPFWMIVIVADALQGGIQVLFGHLKHQSPPLGSGLAWVLKCCVTRWSTLILTWVHNWQVSSCFSFPWVLNTLYAIVGMSWKSYPLKLLKGIY